MNEPTKTAAANNVSVRSLMYNGMIKRNPVLAAGMVIAPVVVFANTFMNAVTLVTAFSCITFLTLLISSFVPQKIVYTVRIILYTLIGAAVYIPTALFLDHVMHERISGMGVYFPLLIINSLIVSRSETTFFTENKGKMILDIIFSILGYDIAVLLTGFVREIISTGEINGNILAVPITLSGLSYPYGGFILLGIMAALLRGIIWLVNKVKG